MRRVVRERERDREEEEEGREGMGGEWEWEREVFYELLKKRERGKGEEGETRRIGWTPSAGDHVPDTITHVGHHRAC